MSNAARVLAETGNHPDVEAAYASAPSTVVAEIANGAFLMGPRPAATHGRVAKRLGGLLTPAFDIVAGGPGGWVFIDEPELHLGSRPDKLQPDMAGWRRAKLPRPPKTAAISTAPDWVCEILSPSTESLDREVKMPLYAEHGVEFVWLVDPRTQVLEAFVREGLAYQPAGRWEGDTTARVAPFDAAELDLAWVWAW